MLLYLFIFFVEKPLKFIYIYIYIKERKKKKEKPIPNALILVANILHVHPPAGAVIFGSLIVAATLFYFINKKKVAVYKPVFDRIPSS